MKRISYIITIIIIVALTTFWGCSENKVSNKKEIKETSKEINESDALLNFFEKSDNFINQKKIPTMITADEVYKNLKKYHLIDIRKHSAYINGHIDGAVNVSPKDLMNYMKNEITTSKYKKIVFICYSNQLASYTTMMFRMLGYSNTYSMKYGMSAVDAKALNKFWGANTSNKYASKLEIKGNPKGKKGAYPKLSTGETVSYKILEKRVSGLLEKPKFKITADEVFANSEKYYIVNYWPLKHYVLGHVPGAVQYSPKKSLTKDKFLSTLPTDKPIVVYCYTGQHAAFATAYLQVLGYDAYTLLYGSNSFMYNILKTKEIGHAFNKAKVFKARGLVKGELPSIIVEGASDVEEVEEDDSPVIPIMKKGNKEEEGGC